MDLTLTSFAPAMPEMFLLGMLSLVLVVDLFLTERTRHITYILSLLSLAGTFWLVLDGYPRLPELAFHGSYINDPMAALLKLFMLLAVMVVLVYSKEYIKQRDMYKGEFYLLVLFATLGMLVLASAHTLLTVYMGLELLSLSMYAMVALRRDNVDASEAAMKYFVLGAMASAMLLYGMSLVYGATGTLDFALMGEAAAKLPTNDVTMLFGIIFMLVGVAFKLGAVPFHMWVPDVYHGAPTAVTLFISSAPKLAAFAMLMRIFVDGLGELHQQWQGILIVMALLSFGLGNLVAIAQTNLKRMLAYSGISHIGFLLLGVLSGTSEGYAASLYYAITYVVMSLGGFGMILLLSRAGFEADKLDDLKGLNDRSPWFALMMMMLMFSMAGVPPFLGFWAKLAVIQAAVGVGLVWLAIAAVVFSVVGAFYYLRIIKLMYFDKPESDAPIESSADLRILLSANSLAVVGLGLFPSSLLAICSASIG